MLIIDINTLETVYTLYLAEHVVLCGTQSLDLQDIMRIHATFCKLVSGLQDIAILDLDAGSVRDKVRPVSYTHLDVYKRQLQDIARLDDEYQRERTASARHTGKPATKNLNNFERRSYDMESLEEQLLNSN